MPRSKKEKVVSLTKVKKKSKDAKSTLIDSIRDAVREADYIYLLALENEKNQLLKNLRIGLRPGKLFCGKNKIMKLALGTMAETECEDNLSVVAKLIEGSCAVLCTKMPPKQVKAAMLEASKPVYAKTGTIASKTVVLAAGTESCARFPHSSEPHLRKLGLPTLLKNGVIHMLGEHKVCTEGEELDGNQASLLKLLGFEMTVFSSSLVAHWGRKGYETKTYKDAVMKDA